MQNKLTHKISISIITPTFNSEKHIESTLNSVRNQKYQPYEHIFIDSLSKDSTLEKIREYKKNAPYLVKIISEKDNGIYDAMNKGIRLSTGELILILNSDDYLETNALNDYLHNYIDSGCLRNVIIVGNANMIKENGELRYKRINDQTVLKKRIDYTMPLVHPSFCVHRYVYSSIIGLFDSNYKICADYNFLYLAQQNKSIEFSFTHTTTVNMRDGGISDTFNIRTIIRRSFECFTIRLSKQFIITNIIFSFVFFSTELFRQFTKKYFSNSILLKTNRNNRRT